MIDCKADFPILNQKVHDHPLVYLDTGASAQKPKVVLEAMEHFFTHDNANIHRGVYALSERAEEAYDGARKAVADFVQAKDSSNIIFTRNTTESINLVAHSYAYHHLKEGDRILLSIMEHHSNIVPWQLLAQKKGLHIDYVMLNADGEIEMEDFEKAITPQTKFISIMHMSNALGTINPIKSMVAVARKKNIPFLVDGAQSIVHQKVDVADLDCDFFTFSGHKLYGPSGIGVLYVHDRMLEQMEPFLGGGGMIENVGMYETSFLSAPHKFEAGTPNLAGAVGLKAAIDYVSQIGFETITAHEKILFEDALMRLKSIKGLEILGNAKNRGGVLSFVVEGAHAHDIAALVDLKGVQLRSGHHCNMPLLAQMGYHATSRVSFGIYNQLEDNLRLIEALNHAIKMLQ